MITIIVAVVVTSVVLGVGALLTEIGPWYRELRKPSWQPPDWLFGPAWTFILGCVAWGDVLAWNAADAVGRYRLILLITVNAVLHVLWSPLFFKWRRPDWALIEVAFLWLSVVALAVGLAPFSHKASWLMVPYLGWVSFAAYLNLTIVRLNGPFRRA